MEMMWWRASDETDLVKSFRWKWCGGELPMEMAWWRASDGNDVVESF